MLLAVASAFGDIAIAALRCDSGVSVCLFASDPPPFNVVERALA
jgi:hypothetical protein